MNEGKLERIVNSKVGDYGMLEDPVVKTVFDGYVIEFEVGDETLQTKISFKAINVADIDDLLRGGLDKVNNVALWRRDIANNEIIANAHAVNENEWRGMVAEADIEDVMTALKFFGSKQDYLATEIETRRDQ